MIHFKSIFHGHTFFKQKFWLLGFILCAFEISNAQVYQFGGINRNGVYNESGLLDVWPETGPELIATITGIGDGYGSPTITPSGIFIAGMIDSTGYVFHFGTDYQLKWKTPVGREFNFKYMGARGTPTVEGDKLYYIASMGNSVCLNIANGEIIWKLNIREKFNGPDIKWGYTESPLLYKDKVFFTPGGPGNNLVALDKTNGQTIWTADIDSTVNSYCSPVIINHNGKDLILLNTSNYILLVDPENGRVLVKHPLTDNHYNHALPPLYFDGKLFYSSGYGEGTVLFKINDGRQLLDTLYSTKDFDCKLSGMIVYKGTVFGTSDSKKQWGGIDLKTGETAFTSRDLKPGSLILADNKFFMFSDLGEVALAKPSQTGFEVISRFNIPAGKAIYAFAHPVISDGVLYIRYNNDLWLYQVK